MYCLHQSVFLQVLCLYQLTMCHHNQLKSYLQRIYLIVLIFYLPIRCQHHHPMPTTLNDRIHHQVLFVNFDDVFRMMPFLKLFLCLSFHLSQVGLLLLFLPVCHNRPNHFLQHNAMLSLHFLMLALGNHRMIHLQNVVPTKNCKSQSLVHLLCLH